MKRAFHLINHLSLRLTLKLVPGSFIMRIGNHTYLVWALNLLLSKIQKQKGVCYLSTVTPNAVSLNYLKFTKCWIQCQVHSRFSAKVHSPVFFPMYSLVCIPLGADNSVGSWTGSTPKWSKAQVMYTSPVPTFILGTCVCHIGRLFDFAEVQIIHF